MKAKFIFEEITHFDRSGDPFDKLKIGHRINQEKLLQIYDRLVDLVQRTKNLDLQFPFSTELLKFKPDRFEKQMGWGNMNTKIDEFTHEEYLEFQKIVMKYWNKIGPEYRIEIQ
jgi:hypothetical protein